jgi:hypothetical protein
MNENTSEGPLTATLGERLAGKGEGLPGAGPKAAPARRGARVPWGALAAAVAGWWLAASVARGVRRGVRRGLRRRGLRWH